MLEELKRRGLLYVDGESAPDSNAAKIADAIGLDYAVVHVQIDAGDTAQQLAKLEQVAKERGAAIGVARANPATIKELSDWAAKLEGKGIVLVPVSAAVRARKADLPAMTEKERLPYRPCVGVMLLNREGRAFVGRRADQQRRAGGRRNVVADASRRSR